MDHLANELSANLGSRFILGKRHVGKVRGMADDA